jgi:hypothetical protein
MIAGRTENHRIRRLAEAVRDKIIADAEVLARAKGKITVECFPKGEGFDIDLIAKIS